MLVKIEARIPIFPGTDFHFPSTSVPPGTFFKALAAMHLALRARSASDATQFVSPLLVVYQDTAVCIRLAGYRPIPVMRACYTSELNLWWKLSTTNQTVQS